MLEGGSDQFNAGEMFEELAASMAVPGDSGALSPEAAAAQQEIQALSRLINMARGSQGGWNLLRRFIGERARVWADRCAAINPKEDPVERHGTQCFNAGAAFGLAHLAVALGVGALDRSLDRLMNPEAAMKALRPEPEMDVI
jgi:hypothetical protein